ncbi:MAG: methyl-accepting chemotaxis protein [Thermodesulfobacteriota bacterium]
MQQRFGSASPAPAPSGPQAGDSASAAGRSLQLRISLVIVVVVTAVLGAMGGVDYTQQRNALGRELTATAESVCARLASNLVNPLWDMNTSRAEEIIASEMHNPLILGVAALDADGKTVFASLMRDPDWKPVQASTPPEQEYVSQAMDILRTEKIGSVRVLVTRRFMEKQLAASLLGVLVRTVVIDAFIVLALVFLIRRYLIRPLEKLEAFASEVGEGNLGCVMAEGRFRGELWRLKAALETMVCRLSAQVEELHERQREAQEQTRLAQEAAEAARRAEQEAQRAKREGMAQAAATLEGIVERINSASREISTQVEEVSQGADTQAKRIAETATAMAEMNATVLEVARNAAETAQRSEDAKTQALAGAQVVRDTVSAIEQVNRQAQQLREFMGQLEARAQDTGQILNVISDIADQTNLLALNAAIEAARAGDAGRGFAVVADEVRKLAEKTMNATKEVESSIRAIQEGTRTSMQTTEASAQAVSRATELSGKSGEALVRIQELVASTNTQVASIAIASEEQSAASEEINRSIESVNAITTSTAQGMALASRSLADLTALAGELRKLVKELEEED